MAAITKSRFQYHYESTPEGHNRVEIADNKTGARFFTVSYDHRKPAEKVNKLVETVGRAYITYCGRVEKNKETYKPHNKMIDRMSKTGEFYSFQPWFVARQESYEFIESVEKAYVAYHK